MSPQHTDHGKPSASADFRNVSSDALRIGSVLRVPIYDERNVLLLAAGQKLTPDFMRNLGKRNIEAVRVHHSEVARISAGQPQGRATVAAAARAGFASNVTNELTDALDIEMIRKGQMGLPPQGEAFATQFAERTATAFDEEMVNAFVTNQEASVGHVDAVYESLVNGDGGLDTMSLSQITDNALSEMTKDIDLFTCLGINPHDSRYPARHSWHVTTLALSIGAQLQLDEVTLQELATGVLIHDSGMLQVQNKLYERPEIIGQVEFLEITKHPVLIFDMMKDTQAVSSRSAFIAYQMHERCDGSGYPRGRFGEQIHFLSKVAAVADSYIALVSPRPHRPGLLPHYAMSHMIRSAAKGLYAPEGVRALLETISLFPIGSYVRLSDGRSGRVIRSNGPAYSRPIIEIPGELGEEPEVIDLKEQPDDFGIVSAIAQLPKPNENKATEQSTSDTNTNTAGSTQPVPTGADEEEEDPFFDEEFFS